MSTYVNHMPIIGHQHVDKHVDNLTAVDSCQWSVDSWGNMLGECYLAIPLPFSALFG